MKRVWLIKLHILQWEKNPSGEMWIFFRLTSKEKAFKILRLWRPLQFGKIRPQWGSSYYCLRPKTFFQVECSFSITNQENVFRFCGFSHFFTKYVVVTFKLLFCPCCMTIWLLTAVSCKVLFISFGNSLNFYVFWLLCGQH